MFINIIVIITAYYLYTNYLFYNYFYVNFT